MNIQQISTDEDLTKAFQHLEKIFQAEAGTAQADERDFLVSLIEAYENRRGDFGPVAPEEAARFRAEQES